VTHEFKGIEALAGPAIDVMHEGALRPVITY
jgi:hypothetical protein